MNYVYKIIFNDRIKSKTPPYFYIGSKTDAIFKDGKIICRNGQEYIGSSKFPNYKDLYQKSDIIIEILESYDLISHNELLEIEGKYQRSVNAKTNPEYFNLDYANRDNSFENNSYASYKHITTGKCIRLLRTDPLVLSGVYVGVTSGNKLSSSHRENISSGITGDKNGFYGKTHSSETIKRISDKARIRLSDNHPRQKPVIINGVKYRGVRPAARELGINPNNIISNIKKNIPGWNYEN